MQNCCCYFCATVSSSAAAATAAGRGRLAELQPICQEARGNKPPFRPVRALPAGARYAGAALSDARRSKERPYPELLRAARRLIVHGHRNRRPLERPVRHFPPTGPSPCSCRPCRFEVLCRALLSRWSAMLTHAAIQPRRQASSCKIRRRKEARCSEFTWPGPQRLVVLACVSGRTPGPHPQCWHPDVGGLAEENNGCLSCLSLCHCAGFVASAVKMHDIQTAPH